MKLKPAPFERLTLPPPKVGPILFSVGPVALGDVLSPLGPPHFEDGPLDVHSKYWAIRIEGVAIVLEYAPDLLAVHADSEDVDFVARKLGLEPSQVTRYEHR